MILADKIIENRKKNGWSQEDLAYKLGVSRQSVSKWDGAQSVPDMKKIVQMSELFGVSTDYLLKDEIEDEAPTGMGILAWYLVPIFDENDKRTGDLLEPAYIGNFKDGRFHGYGILFASSLGGFFGFGDISGASPINSNSGIFYEGEIVKGKFNGKGIAYVSTTSVRVRNEKEYNAVVDLTMERGQKIADKFYILSGEFNDGKFED